MTREAEGFKGQHLVPQVKPENVLITTSGQVKVIDFGAAVDMCTGINFNPKYGMLDPRYRCRSHCPLPVDNNWEHTLNSSPAKAPPVEIGF